MSDLRKRLDEVEDNLTQLRRERADKARVREEAKASLASVEGALNPESEEYKKALSATKSVGETDDKLTELQVVQVGLLKIMGQQDTEAKPQRHQDDDGEVQKAWDSNAVINNPAFKSIQRFAESGGTHIGQHNFGEVASRDAIISKA